MLTPAKLIQHLHWRAGFGPDPLVEHGDYQVEVSKLFLSPPLSAITIPGWNPLPPQEVRALPEEDRKAYQRKEKQARLQLGFIWFNNMVESKNPFQEKLSFFWSGHFACRINSAHFGLNYLNAIRKHATGNFGALLRAMIRDAALLQFLNNNQNRKGNPNENFAREFFELFTLGRGNYSEQDVKEAARTLTGWGFERDGTFVFRKQFHDDGEKVIFGKKGRFTGDDLVDLVLARKECALFISYKLCKFYQSDSPDIALINKVAEELLRTGYSISAALKYLFNSEMFKSESSVGARIKSPVELLTGISRVFSMRFEKQTSLLQMERALGQVLLNPPNVAGWPGGRSWIDSSTLMYRLRLPEVLLMDADTILDAKAEFDAQEQQPSTSQRIKTTYSTSKLLVWAPADGTAPLAKTLADNILQCELSDQTLKFVADSSKVSAREALVFKTVIRLMCLPEYQVC
jgi:uncharacterized protein (DUF1800 family)